MEIKYNKTGKDRKALVDAISSIIGEPAVYLALRHLHTNLEIGTRLQRTGILTFLTERIPRKLKI